MWMSSSRDTLNKSSSMPWSSLSRRLEHSQASQSTFLSSSKLSKPRKRGQRGWRKKIALEGNKRQRQPKPSNKRRHGPLKKLPSWQRESLNSHLVQLTDGRSLLILCSPTVKRRSFRRPRRSKRNKLEMLKPRDRLKSRKKNLLKRSRKRLKRKWRRTWLKKRSSKVPPKTSGLKSSKNKWRKAWSSSDPRWTPRRDGSPFQESLKGRLLRSALLDLRNSVTKQSKPNDLYNNLLQLTQIILNRVFYFYFIKMPLTFYIFFWSLVRFNQNLSYDE